MGAVSHSAAIQSLPWRRPGTVTGRAWSSIKYAGASPGSNAYAPCCGRDPSSLPPIPSGDDQKSSGVHRHREIAAEFLDANPGGNVASPVATGQPVGDGFARSFLAPGT
jgi:hypothetical protein